MVNSKTPEFHNTLVSNGWKTYTTWSPTLELVNAGQVYVAYIIDQSSTQIFDNQIDHTNTVMKNWLSIAPVWTKCMYVNHEFEVIQSGDEKLLMLSEIITKDRDGMRDLTRWAWKNTIAVTMKIPWLRMMKNNEIESIQRDLRIFPNWIIYLSALLNTYDSSVKYPIDIEWHDFFEYDYGYCNYKGPMALRCVVELS
jgi:hypothetical protein